MQILKRHFNLDIYTQAHIDSQTQCPHLSSVGGWVGLCSWNGFGNLYDGYRG